MYLRIICFCICWIMKCFNRHWCTVQTWRFHTKFGWKLPLLQYCSYLVFVLLNLIFCCNTDYVRRTDKLHGLLKLLHYRPGQACNEAALSISPPGDIDESGDIDEKSHGHHRESNLRTSGLYRSASTNCSTATWNIWQHNCE